MKVLKNKSVDPELWQHFFQHNIYASPFQSRAFYDFFNAVPGLSANVYAVEKDAVLKCLCVVTLQKEKGIKGFFSRRAIIYGGPLLAQDEDKEALSLLLKYIGADLKRKAIYIETRNFNNYAGVKDCFIANGWLFDPYLNYHLDCSTEEAVNLNLNTNRKRQVKKAFKNGAVIEEALNLEEVEEYYNILKDLYVNKIKKPLFDLEFFRLFFEKKIGKILLVKISGKIIGGIVCPVLEEQAIYELYICGLDEQYKDLSPSVMATYAAIEYGFKNNLKKFDFMGAGKPDENYGVRDFKAKFGGTLVEHGRFIRKNSVLLFNLGKFTLKMMRRIKA